MLFDRTRKYCYTIFAGGLYLRFFPIRRRSSDSCPAHSRLVEGRFHIVKIAAVRFRTVHFRDRKRKAFLNGNRCRFKKAFFVI